MTTAEWIIGIVLIVLAVLMVTVILSQTGKDQSLSSTITGGSSDTYFGKSGGSTKERILSKVTIVLSVLFVGLAVTLMILLAK